VDTSLFLGIFAHCLKLQYVGKLVCNQWWFYVLLRFTISHSLKG